MKSVIILLTAAGVAFCVIRGMAADNIDRTTVAKFDLKRYMGTWYEIARYDHSFERNLSHVEAHYRLLPDGKVEVTNSGIDTRTGAHRTARGKAHAGRLAGQLRVSFFWFFYSDYNILALGDNYEWALVGSRSPNYLWILSRTPELPRETLDRILRLAEQRGYALNKLLFVAQ